MDRARFVSTLESAATLVRTPAGADSVVWRVWGDLNGYLVVLGDAAALESFWMKRASSLFLSTFFLSSRR